MEYNDYGDTGKQLVKKKEYRYLKSKAVPGKADVEAQKNFLNNTLLPLLDMAVKNEAKVYFCDGVHLIYRAPAFTLQKKERVI